MSTTWKTTSVRHGTQSGWRLHLTLSERPCDPCYAAKSEYDKRRKAAPYHTVMNRLHAKAQARTNTVMRQRHLDEYHEVYALAKAQLLAECDAEITTARARTSHTEGE